MTDSTSIKMDSTAWHVLVLCSLEPEVYLSFYSAMRPARVRVDMAHDGCECKGEK